MAEKKAGGIVHFVREWEQKRMLLRMLEVLDDVRLLKQLLEFVENKLTFLQRKQSGCSCGTARGWLRSKLKRTFSNKCGRP